MYKNVQLNFAVSGTSLEKKHQCWGMKSPSFVISILIMVNHRNAV